MRNDHQPKLMQRGFALVFVMVTILILGLVVTAAMQRAGENIMVGSARQNVELAQILAEAAEDVLADRFISPDPVIADIDGDGVSDVQEGYVDLTTSPTTIPLPYAFWLNGQASPIVQMIATGESQNSGTTLTGQKIASSVKQLTMDNLFISSTIKPILLVQSATGLAKSNAVNWSAETAKNKAAIWVEYEKNPTNNSWTDVFFGVMSQVNSAKGYARKYVGTYTDSLGGMLLPKKD